MILLHNKFTRFFIELVNTLFADHLKHLATQPKVTKASPVTRITLSEEEYSSTDDLLIKKASLV
jgi:hypothetical protein